MCGIAGAVVAGRTDKPRQIVEAIVARQYRRGPDYQEVQVLQGGGGTVVLGHNRLSIIDLSAEANQPMWDEDRQVALVYNGEVYNYIELRAELEILGHRFRTQSDTEVILQAFTEWGVRAVERFNGMFACALYDRAADRLWLVRDRFGVKPLYYHLTPRSLYFASRGGAVAASLGLQPNLEYVSRGLRYWVFEDDSEISPYVDLMTVQPGHYVEFYWSASGELQSEPHSYYNLQGRVESLTDNVSNLPVEELVHKVSFTVRDAIQLRLRADVPVGVSLSGGLDSSTVAAFLSEINPNTIGFTFGHPSAVESEGPLVQELSTQVAIQTEYVWPKQDELVPAFWETMEAQDAPFPNGSIVAQYLVYKMARSRGIKVILGGQGGDELFMGYRKFQVFWLQHLITQRQYAEALSFALSIVPIALAEIPKAETYWRNRHRYQQRGIKPVLHLPDGPSLSLSADPRKPLWIRQMQDITRFSLPTLLRYEDRNSMGNSIESRLPFLDYRLVELALALPVAVKLQKGHGKWILRKAVQGRVPDSIRLSRYKRGFDVNQTGWVQAGLGRAFRDQLIQNASKVREWIEPNTNISEVFSDDNLIHHPKLLSEAISLLWLLKNS